MMPARSEIMLEPAAQDLAEATSKPPFLYEIGYEAARKVLEDLQAAPIDKLPVDEEWVTVPSPVGDAQGADHQAPRHDGNAAGHGASGVGGYWATRRPLTAWFGNSAIGANAALAFVEYPNAPEAATIRWRSSRATPQRSGSPGKGRRTASTPAEWR